MHILPTNYLKVQTTGTHDNKQLHQSVDVGDLLEVEVIDSLQKQLKLLLPDGTVFEAKLDKAIDVYIGQKITLEVKDILGKQIAMEINLGETTAQEPEANVGMKNILTQLGMVATQESEEAVKVLMQKMLPLTKDNIRQVELGLKTSQLPIDTLLSMLENEIPITKSHLTQMENYENNEIKLQGQLETIIEDILLDNNIERLEAIHTILKDAKIQMATHLEHSERLKPTQETAERTHLSNKTAENSEVLINHKPMESKGPSLTSLSFDSINEGENFELGQLKNINFLKKEISDIFKEIFFVRPEELKGYTDTKLKNISKLYKEIYEVIDALEKTEDPLPLKQETTVYTELKSNIEFLNIASKYDTMVQIPLIIQNQYKHGELYIFNQKKNSKKGYHEASMLISLETVSLGTVETYIKKYNKQISCQFKTEDKRIEMFVKENITLLKQNLKNKGYDLTTVTYIPSSQTFETKKDDPGKVHSGRYRFDTKV